MAGKTRALSQKLLDAVLKNTAYSSPATVYVGLYTVAPSDTGGGTEVSGTAYARQSVTFGSAAAGSPSTSTSNAGVTFPVAGGSWGTVVAFGIFDASSAGNLLYFNTMTNVAVATNDQLSIASGQLTVTEA